MKFAPIILARLFRSDCRAKYLNDSGKIPRIIRQSLTCQTTTDHLRLIFPLMPRAHRSYKLSKISFVTFGVRKLLLGNPPHTEANSFKSCKAENVNSQCNRIAHALHTKDVSKLLCSVHTVRNISLVAKIIKHDRYLELRLE